MGWEFRWFGDEVNIFEVGAKPWRPECRQNNGSPRCPCPKPGICEYVTRGKMGTCHMEREHAMWLSLEHREDFPDCQGGPNLTTWVLKREEPFWAISDEIDHRQEKDWRSQCCFWDAGALCRDWREVSRSCSQPSGDSQKGNGELTPMTAWKLILPMTQMSKKTGLS